MKLLIPALLVLALSPSLNAASPRVQRALTIDAPATAAPGAGVHVEVSASTSARDGEQIGFFQVEYSVDGGRTWVPVYFENVGPSSKRGVDFTAGAAGSSALVRARMAFRGGAAGDVDFAGRPIAWGESWGHWASPPARQATIRVVAAP